MPLAIDIAFKWGKKKPEESKKEEDPPTKSTTTCSTVTKTDTTATTGENTSTTVTPESSNLKTLETGVKSKSLSKTAETERIESKTGETNETKKTQSQTSESFDDSKTGMAIDTIEDSNDDDEIVSASQTPTTTTVTGSASATSTSVTSTSDTSTTATTTNSIVTEETQNNTVKTPKAYDRTKIESGNTEYDSMESGDGSELPSNLEPESTQADSASSTADKKKKKAAKTVLKPKIKKSEVQTANSKESTKSSETETEDTVTATTQATEDEGTKRSETKLKTAVGNVKSDLNEKIQRRVILFRHGERMDRVFPAWIRQSNSNGFYRPYNSNHPSKLPKRRNGLSAFESDPPITEIGKIVAQLSGKSLKRSQLKPSAIYSSPAFRCIETAQIIAMEFGGASDLKIKIEYGLFDWCSFYEIPPTFLTTSELFDAGFSVSKNYRSIISKETFYKDFNSETKFDYYRRSHDVIHKILTSTVGTVIIIGHATTIDSTSRALLELSKSIPSNHHLDRLSDRYPYCTSVILEQSNQNGQWRIGKSLLPITFLNQSTKFDKQFLLRK